MEYEIDYNVTGIVQDFRDRYRINTDNNRSNRAAIDHFRAIIYDYYDTYGRKLPWRNDPDPYHVLVSEVMLQQTQVDRVIGKYTAFINRFPTLQKLADAQLEEVLAQWQGLGYNRRGLYLHRLAREVMENFGGLVPDTPEDLVKLPGLGRATAASISVFAFNRPVVFIETNVRTVFIHFYFPDEDKVPDGSIEPLVERTLDRDNPNRWYSALMDYGTMIKKNHPNPGRRSAHHNRQPPFNGSDRQLRGKIIALLLENPGLSAASFIELTGYDDLRVEQALKTMEREGLIRVKKKQYFIG